jgi:cytochrome c553
MKTQQPPTSGRDRRPAWAVFLALASVLAARPAGAEGPTGEQIYRQKCASCHGASGEGSDEYPRVLAGDRSVSQLARLIEKTMPEDAPGECVGEDARRVAAYIHETFYSKAAQSRVTPPRIELSRLTVRQYRNAVADLVGSFRAPGQSDDRRGLRAEYFKSRRFRDRDRAIDRIDPEVRFDFGVSGPGPDPEAFEPSEFSIRWQGSVLAPESGDYEFIVRTEHAMRLWVNDPRRPLIDALVKSGNDNEHRASIRLLGGRVYPLRLEFFKAKQGVDDSKKRKTKPPPAKASIALEWKPPHRAAEVIPRHNLTPGRFPETFVVETPFPPDDRSTGYERGTSVSKAWDQAATDAAIETATYVAARLRELGGVGDGADRDKALREFGLKFAERAFRRPLTDEQKEFYVDRRLKGARDAESAVKRVVLLVLKSPRFLYREIGVSPDAYDVASRLSFGLWDSLPDPALLEAAAAGRLATRDEVAREAERMVADVRTRAKLRDFFLQWLRVEQVPDLSKDPKRYPGFDDAVASDLRTSLDLFLEDVVWGDSPDFRRLLLADYVYLNGRLAKYYGIDLSPDAPFTKVALEPGERAGLVTHPYLLATFAYTAASSPIHRGVFLARGVLGRGLRPPPEATAPLAPDLHPKLTTRERVTLQTSPSACTTCHSMINPLGFGVERFDAVGRYRSEEKGRPVDATGAYETRDGETRSFSGARELAALLAESSEAHTAFVRQLFQYLVKQPVGAFGPRALPDLRRGFAAHDFNVRRLMVDIMATSALATRDVKPGSAPGKMASP